MMANDVWIFLETSGADLAPITRELITKGQELAAQSGRDLAGLVLGVNAKQTATLAWSYGLNTVYAVSDPALERYTTDAYAAAAAALMQEHRPRLLLTGASLQMRDFTASLA